MLLAVLILFLIINSGLTATAGTVIADLPATDIKRRGMIVIMAVLTANTAVFLTLYALYANGFFK